MAAEKFYVWEREWDPAPPRELWCLCCCRTQDNLAEAKRAKRAVLAFIDNGSIDSRSIDPAQIFENSATAWQHKPELTVKQLEQQSRYNHPALLFYSNRTGEHVDGWL